MLMDQLTAWTKTETLVVERLFRYNPSLVWSVGMTIVATRPDHFIECPIRIWKAFCDDNYVKSDEQDAIKMGEAIIWLAKDLK